MNAQFDQLPPVDPTIREQLARRSAGRLPDGLVVDVFAALDSRPPRRTIWRFPRLAVASISVALIAILAVTIAFSGTHTAPAASLAGYPAERALTTAELAALMAGPPLPVNTALVASATIDVRTDVCPMNRYQTQGVVEGMGSQVCVMTADVAVQPMTLTGTFAMRYLAPGYLLLVGALTPASTSGLAFRVADDWPLAGKTFLTQGWLYYTGLTGNDPSACSQASPDANGTYSCTISWMSDSPNATAVHDANGLPGPPNGVPARSVGMTPDVAEMDQITSGRASGTFVVASVTGPCPGAEPQDSRGCPAWRVLAKVADIAAAAPTSPPPPPPSPTSTLAPPATPIVQPSVPPSLAPVGLLGSGNRPLTVAELASLVSADPAGLVGRIAVVKGPVPLDACPVPTTSRPTCVGVDFGSGTSEGNFAVRIRQQGILSLVGGPINVRSDGFVWSLPQFLSSLPKLTDPLVGQSRLYIVDAWLDYANDCDTPDSQPPCVFSVLTAKEISWMHMRSLFPLEEPNYWVQPNDASLVFGPQVHSVQAIHGLYLVDGGSSTILARLEPAVLP
jgi:hypothetical protein